MAQLFPYFVARTTSVDYSELNGFHHPGLIQNMAASRYLQDQKKTLIENTCNLIYDFISLQNDRGLQKTLLNIKRSIFNDRGLLQKDIAYIQNLGDSQFADKLLHKLNALKDIDDQLITHRNLFEHIIKVSRSNFKSTIKNCEPLINGLLLSSLEITKLWPSYIESADSISPKKEMSLEMSLVKYFVRVCTKPSPFSTFTTLSLGHTFATEPHRLSGYKKTHQTESIVRYNNRLFKIFLDVLLGYHPFYSKLRVKLNPSVQKKSKRYTFFINFNNSEAFQYVDRDPLLDEVIAICRKNSPDYESLLARLVEATDETAVAIDRYLQNLTNIGLLEYSHPISLIEPGWEKEFSNFLITSHDNLLNNVAGNLMAMYHLRCDYERGFNTAQRSNILNKIQNVIYDTYTCLFEGTNENEREILTKEQFFLKSVRTPQATSPTDAAHFERSKGMFYGVKLEKCLFEDTRLNVNFCINPDSSKKLEKLLSAANKLSQALLYYRNPKVLTRFFEGEFGNKEVSLLQCYEAYQKKKEKQKETAAAPVNEPVITNENIEINPVEKSLGLYLDDILKQNVFHQQIDLTSQKLNEILSSHDQKESVDCSYSAFIQPVFGHENTGDNSGWYPDRFIINHWITGGYGKFFSRFLHLFDPVVTERLTIANNSYSDNILNCEIGDGSIFNANLHPPLMGAEINIPGGNNGYSKEKILNINDLSIAYDQELDEIFVKHKNQRVNMFDLGFQTITGRSGLFNFLYNFNNISLTGPILNVFINGKYYSSGIYKPVGSELFFPRVTIDDFLIIQRKQWRFYLSDLPTLSEKDTFYEKCYSIEQWREKFHVPQKFFVRHTTEMPDSGSDSEAKKNPGDENHKPVFIDCDNVLLLNILIKMLSDVNLFITLEEVLPEKDNLALIDDKALVSEFLVQWQE